ncbi:MAG: rhodanese-related sulfurtransferase [Ignavibacteria bacterium]|nr:rhodanese-related sulfurtransferase [Ignavibacteria bacterium]
MTDYNVLLYYYFTWIDTPEVFAEEHRKLCSSLGLLGRILVSHEGINGTVSGRQESCKEYIEVVRSDKRFSNIEFKIDRVENHVFQKLSVRVKRELVTFRADDAVPSHVNGKGHIQRKRGQYVEPTDFLTLLESGEAIVIDGRTDYEYDLGHFRGALRPPVSSFREFPEWIRQELSKYKTRKIVTYCTGGIRCEKLTSFMIAEGFTDVYQLHGGIVTYGSDEAARGSLWDGRCYVFDERISIEINRAGNKRIVGKCYHCSAPTERYVNCANLDCHRQHLVCADCEERMQRSCSAECISARRRESLVG